MDGELSGVEDREFAVLVLELGILPRASSGCAWAKLLCSSSCRDSAGRRKWYFEVIPIDDDPLYSQHNSPQSLFRGLDKRFEKTTSDLLLVLFVKAVFVLLEVPPAGGRLG